MARIFCVEDDDGITELIRAALSTGGYGVKTFPDGETFFAYLSEEIPDLIILDILLPGDDGITILRKLRDMSACKRIPIMMLTAKSSELDKVAGLEGGADDYMTKPFGILELLSRIKALLRRTADSVEHLQHTNSITHAGVVLDIGQRKVFVLGNEVSKLTFKEFELLTMLMQNAGLVLSRDRILEKVWGYDFEGETRTVDMHIKSLRQKLDEAGKNNIITTIRGVGYRFEREG